MWFISSCRTQRPTINPLATRVPNFSKKIRGASRIATGPAGGRAAVSPPLAAEGGNGPACAQAFVAPPRVNEENAAPSPPYLRRHACSTPLSRNWTEMPGNHALFGKSGFGTRLPTQQRSLPTRQRHLPIRPAILRSRSPCCRTRPPILATGPPPHPTRPPYLPARQRHPGTQPPHLRTTGKNCRTSWRSCGIGWEKFAVGSARLTGCPDDRKWGRRDRLRTRFRDARLTRRLISFPSSEAD